MSGANLVIVESKGKVAIITKYLNSAPELKSYGTFQVNASFGHIMDLKKKQLGIDVDNDFKATYEPLHDKADTIQNLITQCRKASMVWLASDKDLEGEFISFSLKEILKPKKYKRIVFNEITQKALVYAIQHASDIDMDKVYAQQTRRILDRLVGFKLSPLLWKRYKTSSSVKLSAGRVQSCLLNLIIKREREISKFKSTPYWHFDADFNFSLSTSELKDVKLYKNETIYKIPSLTESQNFLKKINNKFTISDFKNKLTKQSPQMPFITSSLQQDAPFPAKRVMALAQSLYEGGYITYMRTDSYNMSQDFKDSASEYIVDTYGDEYLNKGELKSKHSKNAQEAHECIRITHPETLKLPEKYGKDEQKLYELIWRRSIAYLMVPCIYDELDIKIIDSSFTKELYFLSNFKKVKFNGFQIVYDIKIEKYSFEKYLINLKTGNYKLLCKQIRANNTWTSPPGRYNDAGLSKLMEMNGIARPSTIVTTIGKLEERNYIIKSNTIGVSEVVSNIIYNPESKSMKTVPDKCFVGAEQGKYIVTDVGFEVDKYISENFDYIVDVDFTAHIEADLDKIAESKKTKLTVLKEFWKPFSVDLEKQDVEKGFLKTELKTEEKELKVDGVIYKLRIGPYGPLAESVNKEGKKQYIGLKSYLQLVKKEYLDIDAEDIRFLKSFPQIIQKIEGKDVKLLFGPYGLYLNYDNSNVKIPPKAIREYLDTKTFTKEQIISFIQYAKAHPPQSKESPKTKNKTV
jgi:DNA topoisomerase-1